MYKRTYSEDLRERVISYFETGHSQRHVADIFKIGKSTVNRWFKMYSKTKNYAPKVRQVWSCKVSDEEILKYMKTNADQTLEEIARHFNVKAPSIFTRLRKLGFRYKKKPFAMWKLIQSKDLHI